MAFAPHIPALAAHNLKLVYSKGPYTNWLYQNALGRSYESTAREYAGVEFWKGRNKKYKETILFETSKTEWEAIAAAEYFLNQPLDEHYYQTIWDDLPHRTPWSQAQKWFQRRGDCLTDGIFIKNLTRSPSGLLQIETN